MIRTRRALFLVAILLMLAPAAAMAQGKGGKSSGDMAVSANLGFGNAIDDDFEGVEPFLNGTFEYHTSSEIAWRALLGFVSFEADDVDADIDYIVMNGNIVYYFGGDGVDPYITGGLGLYNTEIDGPGFDSDGDLEIGFNAGGGIDIPIQDNFAIKIEGLFHFISGDGPDTLFTATGGVKWIF